MTSRNVVIVGAGPAGAALAYLLARRDVAVTLLERHLDFARAFRGEGLQPSGLDAFAQMGLRDKLAGLPQATVKTVELWQHGRLRAKLPTERMGIFGAFINQPALLTMLTTEAARFPNFRLEMGDTARDLLHEGDRVVGVRADTSAGPHEFRADLVVGTDGRHSTTRRHGNFTELEVRQNFDILWFKVPFPDFWPDRTTVRLELGDGYITGAIPSSDGKLQTGFTIPKGTFQELRAKGEEAWTDALIDRLSPPMAAHLRANRETMHKVVLLDVIVGRLTEWTAPGLLLLGDAAHPMSPIGGQGVNLALRDALVAANHLCPVLTGGADRADLDAAARRVAAERMPEIITMQEHQDKQAKTFLEPRFTSRFALRLLPLLAKTGLLNLLLGKRLKALQHGVVPVRLVV